jgi:hypothetical protein
MSSVALETYLARLYADPAARARFDADPAGAVAQAGLSEAECAAMVACDRVGLAMAAESFGNKRARYAKRPRLWWRRAVMRLLRR